TCLPGGVSLMPVPGTSLWPPSVNAAVRIRPSEGDMRPHLLQGPAKPSRGVIGRPLPGAGVRASGIAVRTNLEENTVAARRGARRAPVDRPMRTCVVTAVVVAFLVCLPSPAHPAGNLDQKALATVVEQARDAWGVPGLAVAVVQ